MNTNISLDTLLDMLRPLNSDNKRWLAARLYEEAEEESLTPYTREELNARIDEFEAELEAGELLTAEEADKETREALLQNS